MGSFIFLFFVLFLSVLHSQTYEVFDSAKQSALEDLIERENGSDHYYRFNLSQNYPNPFNPSTSISYDLSANQKGTPESRKVVLKIYDILGKEIQTLVNEIQQNGNHEVTFDASHLSSGIYIYRLESDGRSITKKMLLLK